MIYKGSVLKTMNKTCLYIFSILFLLCTSTHYAYADNAAYAYGSEASWGWAVRPTQEAANTEALRLCNDNDPQKNCVVDKTRAIARAEYGRAMGFGRSALGVNDAKKQALEACGQTRCKITMVISEPGFYSLAISDSQTFFVLSYAYRLSDEADAAAIKDCEKIEQNSCQTLWTGSIAGDIPATKKMKH